MKLTDFSFLLAGVLLNAGAQLGLKASTQNTGAIRMEWPSGFQSAVHVGSTPAFWAAITAYGLSVLVWIVGLSRVPVSQAYPMLSLGYVVNAFLAWWLLGEALTLQRVAGIGVVMAGVVMVARS